MDEIEMDEQMEKRMGSTKAADPELQLMEKGDTKGGFDMDYINTNTNEEDAEAASDRGLSEADQSQDVDLRPKDSKRTAAASKAEDVHLSVDPKDYSTARVGQPSFIDNPERERGDIDFSEEMSNTNTWSEMNSMNATNMSASNLDAPRAATAVHKLNKAVTPPPNEVAQTEQDHDIMSSIPNEQNGN